MPQADASFSGGDILLRVEDVFSITGRGTVVTGCCESPFAVGDAVVVVNPDSTCRNSMVTGLERFRSKLNDAQPGENVGVLLQGLSRSDVSRGALLKRK